MSENFELRVEGMDLTLRYLNGVEKSLNVTNLLDESAAILFNRVRSRYIQETDPDGARWAPSQAALKRAQLGQGGGTLYDTGRLFHSLQLSKQGENTRAIGTNVPYATYANDYRNFLGFGDEDVSIANRLVMKRILEALA